MAAYSCSSENVNCPICPSTYNPIPPTYSPSTTYRPPTSVPKETPHPSTKIRNLITIKLDGNNYSSWRSQMVSLLNCYGSYSFVDGSHPCPPRFRNKSYCDINPDYKHWQTLDEIILGSLFSSLSDDVLANVASLQSSRDVWVALEEKYSYCSPSQLDQIGPLLQTIRKGKSSMSAYLFKAQELVDSLANLGHPMLDSDIQQIVLTGLDNPMYKPIVTTLTKNQKNILSMEEFRNHLLAYEINFVAWHKFADSSMVWSSTAVVNLALIIWLAIAYVKQWKIAVFVIVVSIACLILGICYPIIYDARYNKSTEIRSLSFSKELSSSSAPVPLEKKKIKSFDEVPTSSSSGMDNNV